LKNDDEWIYLHQSGKNNWRAYRIAISLRCSFTEIIILNDPLSAEEHDNLGKIYDAHGKLNLALQQYRESICQRPEVRGIFASIGRSFL